MLTFAIGDVHGCLAHLDALLPLIAQEADGAEHRIVCLGDYIDRGPDSAGVVRRLRALQAASPERVTCLLGNHEDLLLQAVARPEREGIWLQNGGETTLASYGRIRARDLPPDDLAWIAGLPRLLDDGRRVFVHAGVDPTRPLGEQRPNDLVWIRDEFLQGDHDLGRYVVHGHTPRIDGVPDLRPHRVNIDTAAVYGGRLTAAIFRDGQDAPSGFLQVPA